ncbi:MAG: tetratricopeptide repeat protein [Alphaproteobacteria bacterium]|nr:tetratricopeptide repeat protein [Alphaproteobacteria bacterium]
MNNPSQLVHRIVSVLFLKYIVILSLFLSQTAFGAGSYDLDDSSNYEADYKLGLELIKKEKYEPAISKFKKLIDKKSDNYTQADIYNYLGYTHRKLKKFDDAETYYLKALKLDSDHVGALEYIGELYLETYRIEEAKNSLQKLKSVAGESSEEYIELSKLISNYTQ